MKPQIDVVSRLECHGPVKYTGLGSGTVPWKTGSLVVHCYDGSWKIDLSCASSPKPLLSLKLDPTTILKVICKSTVVIELKNGSDYTSLYYRPLNDRDKTSVKQISDLLVDLQQNYSAYEHKISQSGLNGKTTTYPSPSVSRFGSVKKSNMSPSPQKFTSVKEPRKREKYLLGDFSDDECKENEIRSPYNTGNSDMFLQRGTEKAREQLEMIGPSNFYKTSTPASSRHYGGLASYSSSKRTIPLGLMPDPTSKKSRLSEDVPYTWNKNRQSQQTKQVQQHFQGFSNLGNTCYMNAILQSLFGLDTFSTDILHINKRILKVVPPDSLYFSLARLLNIRKRIVSDQTKRDILKNVKLAISSSAKRFSGYQQHDAHEFLGQVLDQLKEEVNKVLKSTPSPHRDGSDREDSASHEYVNPTYQNFEFEVLHTITCTECKENVSKAEQFNDLSMEMPKSRNIMNTRSIQEALDLFFRKETLEYTCEKCGCNKAEVTHKFTRLPRVLVLHLKRYRYDMSAARHAKVGHNIHIPRFLTLQSHCVEETTPAFPAILSQDQIGYRFKKSSFLDSSDGFKSTEQNSRTPCKKLRYDDSKNEDGIQPSKPITLEDDDDPELAKVLELSLKEANDKTQNCTEEGLFGAEDSEFEKVLEMSRLENEKSASLDHDYEKDLQGMSEDEQLRLAIEQSLRDTNFDYSCTDDVETTNTLHSSRSTTVSSMDTDLSSGNQSVNHSTKTNQNNRVFGLTDSESNTEDKTADLEKFLFGSGDDENDIKSEDNDIANLSESVNRTSVWQLKNEKNSNKRINDSETNTTHLLELKDNFIRDSNRITSENKVSSKSLHLNGNSPAKVKSDTIRIEDFKNESGDVKSEIKDKREGNDEYSHGSVVQKQENVHVKTDKESICTNTEQPSNLESDDDFTLFCTEDSDMDNDWLSLENKENKKPHIHDTNNSINHVSDENVDDIPVPIVDNEKGDLPYSYRLISVVNHIGNSSVVGHYVSDVYDIQKGCWYSCDDSHVVKASESEVRTKRERSGYIFFYLSKEIFEDLQTHFSLQNGKRKSSDY